MPQTIAIVGANACGVTAAATLREEGFDGRVVLIDQESQVPYERPPLSKEVLRADAPQPALFRPADWWEEEAIDLRLGTRAERLDAAGAEVVLADGQRIAADGVLLATGIRNRALPGSDFANVFCLRTADDAAAIREAAQPGARAVVVGMGFIGAEVAASLRDLGCEVTIVEPMSTALARVLGPLGDLVAELHRERGSVLRFGEGVDAIEGDADARTVVTTTGARLACDLVVVGVGTIPNTEMAAGSGLATDNGILVDARLETSTPGVFAGGDVANVDHPRYGRIRTEHFDGALKMGALAARSLLGAGQAYDEIGWFWSDIFDCNIQMAGRSIDPDATVVRGDLEARDFAMFSLRDGVVEQVVAFNRPREVRRAMGLIRAGARPDLEALADGSVDLRTLA